MFGKLQHQRLQRALPCSPSSLSSRRRSRAGFLGLPAELGLLLGRGVLELRADGVALGAQRVDLGLERAHLGVEREQRVEVERDALVADRALDRVAVRP